MITRREAKEIVDWVLSEVYKKRFPYTTDGKIDLTKTVVGPISGTQTHGGPIADGAIWDRHVHPDADIRGTKVRIATTAERGTVQLGTEGEALVPTMSGLATTVSGLGANLIGVYDPENHFTNDNVQAALYQLFATIATVTFLDLLDTPNQYTASWEQKGWIPAINQAESGLEFKPMQYIDGRGFVIPYSGMVEEHYSDLDGGAMTECEFIDAGYFPEYKTIRTASLEIAASDAGYVDRLQADYVCDGVDD